MEQTENKTIYIDEIWISTTRNWMVFDNYGNEIIEYQKALTEDKINKKTVKFVLDNAQAIFITRKIPDSNDIEKFEVSADEIKYLLGIHNNQRRTK